jgi:outer membrane receptor protein involved in Fe transport
VLSVNGLLATDEWKSESHFFSAATDERFVGRSSNDRGEIGLNFTRPLGSRFELEAIALWNLAAGTGRNTGVTDTSSSLFEVEAEAGESIGRTVLRYTRSPELAFEGGGEIVFNHREQQVALTVDGAAVTLPASDVRVEELRGEGFVQGTWRPTQRHTLEAGIRVEESTITQSGEIARERSFVYPKPRVLATWSPTERDQVRLRIEREVGQLNLRDFVSNVNLNTRVLSAGNAELEPDKTWVYELALEKRFWSNGAAVLTLRHEDIEDVVDVFPFSVLEDVDNDGDLDEVLVSGPGNIGEGTNDFAQLTLTLPLANLGLQGAEIELDATFQNGEVRDPLTGETRIISGQRPDEVSVSFRQDLPARHLTFGVFWYKGWSERYFQLEEVQALDLRNYWEASVEYKPTSRLTLEAGLNNFIPYSFAIERQVFDGPRDTGSLAFVETERRNSQVIASVRARLSFE